MVLKDGYKQWHVKRVFLVSPASYPQEQIISAVLDPSDAAAGGRIRRRAPVEDVEDLRLGAR